MARARNGNNQRGTYGRKPVGPIGKKPTPRTGGGMKLPTKKVMGGSTGGGMKVPTKKMPMPKTGGGMKLAKKKYTSSPKPSVGTPVDRSRLKKRKVPGSRGGSRNVPTTTFRKARNIGRPVRRPRRR